MKRNFSANQKFCDKMFVVSSRKLFLKSICSLVPAASQLKWHLTGDSDYQLCRVFAELHTISGALAALLCGLTGSLLQGFQAPTWQSVLTVQQSESLENTGISMFSVPLVGRTSFTLYPFMLRVSRTSSLDDRNHESLMFSLFGTFS